MKEVFGQQKVFAAATASKNGIPNVAPVATVQLVADDTIWIGDNYMVKTLANVKENPHLALYIWAAHRHDYRSLRMHPGIIRREKDPLKKIVHPARGNRIRYRLVLICQVYCSLMPAV